MVVSGALMFDSLDNLKRRLSARMHKQDTYVDNKGAIRYARQIKRGEVISMPAEQLERILKNGR